eukprot:Rmarinus@m.26862
MGKTISKKNDAVVAQSPQSSSVEVAGEIELSSLRSLMFPATGGTRHHSQIAVLLWGCKDVMQWLRSVGFGIYTEQYLRRFEEADVDGLKLVALTDETLRKRYKIRLKLHRQKLLKSLEYLLWPPPEGYPLETPPLLSIPPVHGSSKSDLHSSVKLKSGSLPSSPKGSSFGDGEWGLGNIDPVMCIHDGTLHFQDQAIDIPPEAIAAIIPSARIRVGQRIGVGGCGEVFIGNFRGKVAVKRLFDFDLNPRRIKAFVNEVAVMTKIKHPNIVEFLGWCMSPLSLVMEYCEGGSLWSLLRRKKSPLDYNDTLSVGIGITKGLKYMHSLRPRIIHQDLKSPNVLLSGSGEIKISDFGASRIILNTRVQCSKMCGTPSWTSPEACLVESVNENTDLYSFGIILWELLTGEVPWEGYHPMQVCVLVCGGQRPPIPNDAEFTHPGIPSMIQKCWAQNAKDRPSATQVLVDLNGLAEVNPVGFVVEEIIQK